MFHTSALVLKKTPFYEVDNLITLYSQDFGKIEVVSRGTQKIVSKLSAHLEPLNLIYLEFVYGNNFKIATSAQIIENFQNIKNDFNKTKLALEVLNYIDKYVLDQENDSNLGKFLSDFIFSIEKRKTNLSESESMVFGVFFLINFLKFLGFLPALTQCSRCGKLNLKNANLISKQGLLCDNCHRGDLFLNNIELKILNEFLEFSNSRKWWNKNKEFAPNILQNINFLKIKNILNRFLKECY